MATITYFISESYLKDQSIINLNVEPALVKRAILDGQILHIQVVLGSNLYDKIAELISTGTISDLVNAKYKTLLDSYIVPTLVQWSMVEVLPYLRFKVMNKTVGGQNSENTEPSEIADFKYFQQTLRDKAEFYSQRLSDHLVCNSKDYPEYCTGTTEDLNPETNNFFCGMQFDSDKSIFNKTMGYNNGITPIY